MFHPENAELQILRFLKQAKNKTANLMDYKQIATLLDQKIGPQKKTLIHYLAEHGCTDALEQLDIYTKSFGNYEEMDTDGCTPLHLACEKRHYATVNFLIDVTDNLIAENKAGIQPLMYLEQERDKILGSLGLTDDFFAKAQHEHIDNLSMGDNTTPVETYTIVQHKKAIMAKQPELKATLTEVHKVTEALTNAIQNRFSINEKVTIISGDGKTTIKSLVEAVQSNKPGFTIAITGDVAENAVPFVGDRTQSLMLRNSFIAEFKEFLSSYKEGSKENTILKKLAEIPVDNWLAAAGKIIKDYEQRTKKVHLVYEKGFVMLIEKLKNKLDDYSSQLVIESSRLEKEALTNRQSLKLY